MNLAQTITGFLRATGTFQVTGAALGGRLEITESIKVPSYALLEGIGRFSRIHCLGSFPAFVFVNLDGTPAVGARVRNLRESRDGDGDTAIEYSFLSGAASATSVWLASSAVAAAYAAGGSYWVEGSSGGDTPAILGKSILAYGGVAEEGQAVFTAAAKAARVALNNAAITAAIVAATTFTGPGTGLPGAVFVPSGTFLHTPGTCKHIGRGNALNIVGEFGSFPGWGGSILKAWLPLDGGGAQTVTTSPVLELGGAWRGIVKNVDFDASSICETGAYVHSDQFAVVNTGAGFQGYVFDHVGVRDVNPDAADPVVWRVGYENVGATHQCDLTLWTDCSIIGSATKPWRVAGWKAMQGGNTTTFRILGGSITSCRYAVDALRNSETLDIRGVFFSDICGPLLTVESVDAVANTITVTGHRLVAGDRVRVDSTGTVPGGLFGMSTWATALTYWVVNPTANTLQLSTSPGGAAIDITSAGTGTIKLHCLDSGIVRGGETGSIVVAGCNIQNAGRAGQSTVGRAFSGVTMGGSGPSLAWLDNTSAMEDTPDLVTGEWLGQLAIQRSKFIGVAVNAATFTARFMSGGRKIGVLDASGATPGAVDSSLNRWARPRNVDGTTMDAAQFAARGAYAPFYAFGGASATLALTGWDPVTGGSTSFFGVQACPVYSKGDLFVDSAGLVYPCEDWDGSVARCVANSGAVVGLADGALSAIVVVAWPVAGVLRAGTTLRASYADPLGTHPSSGVELVWGRHAADSVWYRWRNNSGAAANVAAGRVVFTAKTDLRVWT